MKRTRLRADDAGFTLIELIITIVIMGVITLPLANFMLAYLKNYTQTESRLSDSHDIQIATAYFSQDVANIGLRSTTSPYDPQTSVWTTGFPANYCGSTLGGTTLLLLAWDDQTWSAASGTATKAVDSVAYIAIAGTLRRAACSGSSVSATTLQSNTAMAHNLFYPDAANPSPATTSGSGTVPSGVSLKLSIKGETDTAPSYITLSGQRRQSS